MRWVGGLVGGRGWAGWGRMADNDHHHPAQAHDNKDAGQARTFFWLLQRMGFLASMKTTTSRETELQG